VENELLVFVSSAISGMEAERAAVKAAVEAIPLTRPWLFEFSSASSLPLEESYLSQVRRCDIFVLLLGHRVSEPVKLEVQTATDEAKPRLVFLSASAPGEVVSYAQSLDVKYATYADPDDLAAKVAEAVGQELIRGFRSHGVPPADLGALGAFLGRLAAGDMRISIVGGDQITTTGPVATHGSVIATGRSVGVAGDDNTFMTGDVGGDFLAPGATKIVQPDSRAAATRRAEERARCRYLERLRRQCQALPLAALGGEETGDQDVTLDQVYIELNTTTTLPLTPEDRETLRERKMIVRWEREEDSHLLSALEAAKQSPRLVLLGEAGAGKSTFARMLLGQLAAAHLGDGEPPAGLPAELFPILVTLRDLVPRLNTLDPESLPADRQQETLAAIVRDQVLEDLARLEASDCAELLRDALTDGRCLLVLDGLDEVPQALRKHVRLAVAAVIARYAPQRIIVTCRARSYVGDAVLTGFREHTLAPFDEERIRRFVAAWYNAQKTLGRVDAAQAQERTADLADAAVAPDLIELSANPMMLTTMAIIHQKEIGLPRERVRLYNLAVDVLLRRWQKHRTGEQAMAPSQALVDFLKDDLRLRAALERLAYDAHSRGIGHGEAAELTRGRALELLEAPAFLGSAGLADEFLDYVDQRAGLLVGRGGDPARPTTYAFPHRTFQEYLAGCYLVGGRNEARARAYFGHAGEADWRLAALLGAEELYYNRRGQEALLDLAYRLCPEKRPADARAQRAVLWSGAMAAVAGRELIEQDTDSPDGGHDYLERLLSHLLDIFGSSLPSPERADAGRILGQLGDPRPEVLAVDDMALCWAPAGPFWLGSDPERDPMASEDETPKNRVDLPGYYISRYPITNAQFAEFVAANGYGMERLWREARSAGVWSDGRVKAWGEDEPRDAPYDYGAPFDLPNHPVVGVTWYEALAFARWLSRRWRDQGRLPAGWEVTLPSEAQWEKAARGGLQIPSRPVVVWASAGLGADPAAALVPNASPERVYPWDGECTPERANYDETNIGATTAVGLFPAGASPYGALDMSGNVWEWCLTKWRKDYSTPADDSPEDDAARVLRGGAFGNDAWSVRCACRVRHLPYLRVRNCGFRVVASPIIHDSGG
jgi:formylglycine-generating enzyme required for sulfatase activity